MSRRIERVNSVLREEVSDLIQHSLKDPRLAAMGSVVRVEASPDLASAKVYVSVLGGSEEKAASLAALTSAGAYLKRELRDRLHIKRLPDLLFELDESIERGSRLLSLMARLSRERGES